MWPGPRPICVPSFIFIHPTVWPEYTNVTHRHDRTGQTGQRSDSIGRTVFERPFVKQFVLCYRSVVCPVCLSVPVCDVRALWPNGWTEQDETRQAGRPRPWPHCVRWGSSSHSPKGAQPPNFRPMFIMDPAPTPKGAEPQPIFGPRVLWPNGCMDQDATWYGGRSRPTRYCV